MQNNEDRIIIATPIKPYLKKFVYSYSNSNIHEPLKEKELNKIDNLFPTYLSNKKQDISQNRYRDILRIELGFESTKYKRCFCDFKKLNDALEIKLMYSLVGFISAFHSINKDFSNKITKKEVIELFMKDYNITDKDIEYESFHRYVNKFLSNYKKNYPNDVNSRFL